MAKRVTFDKRSVLVYTLTHGGEDGKGLLQRLWASQEHS